MYASSNSSNGGSVSVGGCGSVWRGDIVSVGNEGSVSLRKGGSISVGGEIV